MKIREHLLGSLGLALFFAASCASLPDSGKKEAYLQKFIEFQAIHPNDIWAPQLNTKAKQALNEFRARRKLKNGLEYGESVRTFRLENKTAGQIDRDMKDRGCRKKAEILKNPQTKSPLVDAHGSTIPMDTYLCPDGGVVRVKPKGDSTSLFRPQPHASKALRFPFDSEYKNFDDEAIKVDRSGNPIPKWVKDLNQVYQDPTMQKEFVEGWAEDAHVDLEK